MTELLILQDPEVARRTSAATRRVLAERIAPAPYTQFLSDEQIAMLRSLVNAILPQASAGTHVDIAEAIDRRLSAGVNGGYRYAVLPPDGEAYRKGLAVLFQMVEQESSKTFDRLAEASRERYLRSVCDGDVDGPAQFPLSTFVRMVRTDAVRFWMAHPEVMRTIGYFGFADGATGNEGWHEVGPNSPARFEHEAIQAASEPAGAVVAGKGQVEAR